VTDARDCRLKAADYLDSLRSLRGELERAMQAIAANRLGDLEESVGNQQVLSLRLRSLAEALSENLDEESTILQDSFSADIVREVRAATSVLESLSQRYAVLLRHSSRCAGQMASLLRAFRPMEAGEGAPEHRSWSCLV
jgi:DNA repair exonuclease SbcCD ATPase subunit